MININKVEKPSNETGRLFFEIDGTLMFCIEGSLNT
jgi:hypothetical protein